MITKLEYDNDGAFQLAGTIKPAAGDEDTVNSGLEEIFLQLASLVRKLKICVKSNLEDDNRILGSERVQVVNIADEMLTIMFSLAFRVSDHTDFFMSSYSDNFEIQARLNKMQYLSAVGHLKNTSADDIADYLQYIETEISAPLRDLIRSANGSPGTPTIAESLTDMFYRVFVFRFRVEYV